MSDDREYLPSVDDLYLPFWAKGAIARVIRDNPPMYGFGRDLKKGETVIVKSVVWRGCKYELCIPAEYAFYEMIGCFEPVIAIDAPKEPK